MALTELTAALATSRDTEPRAILLACDDYSAVSGRVPLWQLYERGRSLGIGVQVSAQSWQGLGDSEDERYRIAATADGGVWLLRTPYPQPVCELAGTQRIIETATKVIGGMWGDEGSSRVQHAWTVNPQIARQAWTPGRPPTSTPGAAHGCRSPAPSPHPCRSCHRTRGPHPRSSSRRRPCSTNPHPPAGCAGGPGRRVRAGGPPMNDPFAALGLPARPDLSDEQVRTAWRTIAAATHPDRPGGGNPAAYAAASAAYAALRTPWGRSEAYADLIASGPPSAPAAARPAPGLAPGRPVHCC